MVYLVFAWFTRRGRSAQPANVLVGRGWLTLEGPPSRGPPLNRLCVAIG